VNNSFNAFAVEGFIDELAAAAKQDPYEYRRTLLANAPRDLGVLELAATKAGWGTPLPAGRGRGIAVYKSFESFAAQVAEVSVSPAGDVRVHRVVCAIDLCLHRAPSRRGTDRWRRRRDARARLPRATPTLRNLGRK